MLDKFYICEHYPDLVAEWDYEKNHNIDIQKTTRGSAKVVWWKCSVNPKHNWQARVSKRSQGTGCPYCSGHRVLKEESFAEKYPEILKEWDYKENKNHDPWLISENSNYNASWICQNNSEHKWKAQVYSRTKNKTGCKKCSYKDARAKRKKENLLINTHPQIAKEWDKERNKDYDLNKITYGSSQKYWWRCSKDSSHLWEATVTGRTNRRSKCPYCNNIIIDDNNSLKSDNPELAKEWHPTKNNDLTPDKITRASSKKVWWQCQYNKSHEWQATVQNRNLAKSGCPHCEKIISPLRIIGFIKKSIIPFTSQYEVLAFNIYNVQRLVNHEYNLTDELYSILLRQCHASIIASLEAYLSDLFYTQVINCDESIIKLLTKSQDLKDKKYTVHEVVAWHKNQKKKVEEYVFEIIWHNIPKVKHLYKNVLSINLPNNNEALILKAISIRHDIVHRNGVSKTGEGIRLSKENVLELSNAVKLYVEEIEKSLQLNLSKEK